MNKGAFRKTREEDAPNLNSVWFIVPQDNSHQFQLMTFPSTKPSPFKVTIIFESLCCHSAIPPFLLFKADLSMSSLKHILLLKFGSKCICMTQAFFLFSPECIIVLYTLSFIRFCLLFLGCFKSVYSLPPQKCFNSCIQKP